MPNARGDVEIRLSAEEYQIVRAFLRTRQEGIGGLAKEFDSLNQKSQKSGKAAQGQLAGITRQANSAAAAFFGVGGAIASLGTLAATLRSELEMIRQLQRGSGESQLSIANAQRRAAFALGTKGVDSDMSIQEVTDILRGSKSGVPIEQLLLEFEKASSSRGSLSARAAAETVAMAARMRPDLDTESRGSMVTAALALQKAYGASPAETLAGVQQSLLAARTEDIGAFSRNLIPNISQARSFGGDKDSYEFLASLFLGVGQRSEDPSGRRTATNTLKFIEQIMTLAKTKGIVGQDATVEETLKTLTSGEAGSDAEKLRQELVGVFNKNLDEIPAEFAELKQAELNSEAKTRVALLEVLDRSRTSKTWDEINAAQQKVAGLNDTAVKLMNDQLEVLKRLPEQQAAESSRALEQSLQRLRMGDPAGVTGLSNEQVTELLRRSGQSVVTSTIGEWGRSIGAASGASQEAQIRRQISQLEGQLESLEGTSIDRAPGFIGDSVRWSLRSSLLPGFTSALEKALDNVFPVTEQNLRQREELRLALEQLNVQLQRMNGNLEVTDAETASDVDMIAESPRQRFNAAVYGRDRSGRPNSMLKGLRGPYGLPTAFEMLGRIVRLPFGDE